MKNLIFTTPKLARRGMEILLALLIFACGDPLEGNDSAAEIGAGGIQPRKESRISLEKERLTISLEKVVVEYEFLNSSNEDIATEVAFPIPPYKFDPLGAHPDFSDFRVWVDGQEMKYQTEVRAELQGTDYARMLTTLGVDIQDFGHFQVSSDKSQISLLSKSARDKLIRVGLLDDDGTPCWTTIVLYHWTQLFPAQRSLHVRHEYQPNPGYTPVYAPDMRNLIKEACVAPALQQKLRESPAPDLTEQTGNQPTREAESVKYILTTANTWKTPIRDFQLILEEPDSRDPRYVGFSVCWDGEWRRLDKNHLASAKANFIPKSELVVYYFEDYYHVGIFRRLK